MQITKAEFKCSSERISQVPKDDLKDIAFIGRSNVGKSSLINMLTARTGLAKVSGTPGKTRLINHFRINDAWYLVDLPGYGYARVSGDERRRWGALMEDFFQEPNLYTMGVLIVDSRHAPTADDVTMAEYFFDAGRPFVVVANKCDKLKKSEIEPNLERIRDVLGLDDDFPLLLYSCTAKVGRRELLGFIENNI